MKLCKICGKEKPLSEFSIIKKKYPNSYCRPCDAIRYKETRTKYYNKRYATTNGKAHYKKYYYSLKDGLHYVYYLPEEHYIGVTDCISKRIAVHKHKFNRYVDNIEIVYKTPCRKEAELVESKLHSLGYQG